jgi:polysaccharide biosynthesis/export protein
MELSMFHILSRFTALLLMAWCALGIAADKPSGNYKLGPGDAIRVVVFQNPDLTLDTRVSENGAITYPLIGGVQIGGLTLEAAEQLIASRLKSGGFVQQPQVNIVLNQVRGNQVSVLGQVNRPGRFPLETFNTRLSDVLAMAGGIAPTGSDVVIVTGTRDGKSFRKEIDFPDIFAASSGNQDIVIAGGDVVYVNRAPVFYIYGEAQRPGAYRIERGMTVQKALAMGGGATQRGSDSRIRINRKDAQGKVQTFSPELSDPVLPEDVIYVRESIL